VKSKQQQMTGNRCQVMIAKHRKHYGKSVLSNNEYIFTTGQVIDHLQLLKLWHKIIFTHFHGKLNGINEFFAKNMEKFLLSQHTRVSEFCFDIADFTL
jgi:hypothetical protein